MSNSSSSKNGGIGILGMLFVLFVGLKLTHNIDWSWWWVTAPLWGPLALVSVSALIAFVVYMILKDQKK